MKIRASFAVGVVTCYDGIDVEIEVPDDATPEQIREVMLQEAQYLRQDPYGGCETEFSHAEGFICEVVHPDLEYDPSAAYTVQVSVGDPEARF